ncbi:MAG: AAA family ATPase [Ramlibacter sp.]
MLCAKCRQENPDSARFCNQCGAPLAAAAAPELRRLTLMFCDLVGSVELANRIDPEEWLALLAAYQASAATAIRRQHGYVAQHLGDGLVAYFGYPLAGEDDAVRAVQAGLDVVREVGTLALPGGQGWLQVRVGLHTGPAVMGQVGGREGEYLALGDTVNVAARIQAAAPPNGVVLSPATRSLVASRMRCVDLGEHVLKGLATPLRLYQAHAMEAADEERAGGGLSPFLGRAGELDLLLQRWQEAAPVAGRCVLLTGDPGIGKSRLARELRAAVAQQGAASWMMRCSAHGGHTPFAPLVQFLRRAMAGTGDADGGADALDRVLAAAGVQDETVAGPLRAMLGIEGPGETSTALSAQALRERTFAAATTVVRTMAARQRLLLVLEDLHWADPSTLEWVGLLLKRDLPGGVLLLLLARPEFDARWADHPRVERMVLQPCGAADAAVIVATLDRQQALEPGAVQRIVERAEGNPLFVEEFTRSALEALGEDIPLTLQEQTLARLDRLGPARQVLQQAAVIGRHFSRRLLQAASGADEAAVDAALRRGVEAHMLRPTGGDTFVFHHALLRDAAYASLLRSARQASHARVAQAILAEDAAIAERQPELLAHHHTEAGQRDAAVTHWLAAAQRALARSACVEAAVHAGTALRLLEEPGSAAPAPARELELQLVLAPALMAVRGVLDPQVAQAYARARALCAALGNGPKLLVPLWGLWAYELMRGEVDRAWEASQQLAALAGRAPTPVAQLVAAATAGMTLFYRGDFRAARAECARGLGQVRLPPSPDRSARGFHDPGVMCHAFHGLACWMLGETDEALAGAAALRAMIPALAPFDAAYAWCADAVLQALAGDAPAASASALRAMAVSKEQAFPAWQLMGSLIQGWATARQGNATPAIAQMLAGFDAWCAGGARNLRPFFLALLADAWLAGGQPLQAVRSAGQGLLEAATGEHWWDPELHRLRAEGLAVLGETERALESAGLALADARRMEAVPWAARAEQTLARLRRQQEPT